MQRCRRHVGRYLGSRRFKIIGDLFETHEERAGELAEGLALLMTSGVETPEAEAALLRVSEVIMLHRAWLLSHRKTK